MTLGDVKSRPARAAMAAGLLVAVFVAVGGFAALSARPERWTAKVSVVVLPASTIDTGAAANYYDTLSRGQVTATIAEILRLPRFRPTARCHVAVAVAVVPNTSLIAVTATAPNARTAEGVADTVVDQASSYVSSLTGPYHVTAVNRATGTATKSSTTSGSPLAVLVVAALAAGIGAQQAVHQLLNLGRARQQDPAPVPHVRVTTAPSGPTNGDPSSARPSRAEPVASR